MEKKNEKIPFWLQITAIILLGVIVSGGVLFFFNEKNAERFTVKFAYGDGTVIEAREVKTGKGIMPPQLETDGVFRGWSGPINNVNADTEVHPVIYDIVEDNLFYFDSVYVKEGKNFTLDIFVAGNVSVSSGELNLYFDPEVITYKSFDGCGISGVDEIEDGKLHIKFYSENPLTEKTKIVSVTLHTLKKDVYSTEIRLESENVKLVESGAEKPADNATINNKLYFLQEVDK